MKPRPETVWNRLLEHAKRSEHTFMVAAAVVIGCLSGLGAVAFRYLISVVQRITWGDWVFSLDRVRAHPWWWIALAPAVGGLLVGPLVFYFAREAKGHGVPEVMEAVALRSGVIRARLVVIKSLASALSIGTGASVGREGPIVQIGAALGSNLGQWLRVSGQRLRTLVGCGAAAGIAATFNAPIAGPIFAAEVILGDFGVAQFSPIVISSVIATVISRYYLGDFPAFIVPGYELVSAWELPIYFVLGAAAALVALVFVKVLYFFEDWLETVPWPAWITASLGGLAVGCLGIAFPEVFGVGYEAMDRALAGEMGLGLLAILLLLKILATSITLGSGGSGGIFAPSLFIGAMTGGLLGTLVHQVFPGATASPGAYALVGMGAVVAGTTHAPITAILILFELTSDYQLIVPLMTSCIIASLIASRLEPESIYTMKLTRRGSAIRRGQDLNVLRALKVRDVMSDQVVMVREDKSLGELVTEVADHPQPIIYVVDTGGAPRVSSSCRVCAWPSTRARPCPFCSPPTWPAKTCGPSPQTSISTP